MCVSKQIYQSVMDLNNKKEKLQSNYFMFTCNVAQIIQFWIPIQLGIQIYM